MIDVRVPDTFFATDLQVGNNNSVGYVQIRRTRYIAALKQDSWPYAEHACQESETVISILVCSRCESETFEST